jgi:hypothetical protein
VTVFAALVAFLLAALPARADETAATHALLYISPSLCVHGQSILTRRDTTVATEWNKGLYPEVILATFSTCNTLSTTYYMNEPTGWTAIGRQLWYWSGNAWTVCQDFGWASNGEPLASQDLQVWNGLPPHPCGVGYYGLQGGFFAWDGYKWQGGWLWSGYLYSQ